MIGDIQYVKPELLQFPQYLANLKAANVKFEDPVFTANYKSL